MRPPEPGTEDTIRVLPPSRRSRTPFVAAVAVLGLLVVGVSGWLLWPRPAHAPLPPAVTSPAPAPPPAAAPAFPIQTATEDQILHHVATVLTVFRFASNPNILVLDFPSLHEQGLMLNRVAALVEKESLPREHVLTDAELAAAIQASGDTVDTYYYGHDYSTASLRRFFALSDQEQLRLEPEEQELRDLLRQVGWFEPAAAGGLISIPAVGADSKVTLAARGAILRHELSHGEFFSNPNYAAYVYNFWLTALTEKERAGVRSFLGKEEYDTHEEELMYNEMQAYLMFTRDPLFFTPDMAGLTAKRLSELQAQFLAGMPAGWLRDVLASYPSATASR
jgi:hypothetical protein